MARSLLHIPWRIVRAVLLTALAGVLLFFAATRTQVGRNELRQELQRQFADRFAGTLTIGTLQGNLVNDLFASDIRVTDPSGRTVLAIDSLVARPRWVALFTRQLAFRSITARAPTLTLHRDTTGRWNLQQAFAREARPDTSRPPPAFTLADLRVIDGAVTTSRSGPPPAPVERDWLFDYATAQLTDLQAHATVEWVPGDELVDVFALSGTLPGPGIQLNRLQGQLLGSAAAWTLNQLRLQTAATDLTLDATVPRLNALDDLAAASAVNLDLAPSTIDFDELRRLVPRLPLADALTASAQVSGPPSGLVIENLQAERGASRLALEGTLMGLPDVLDYELSVRDSRLTQADVQAVAPSLDLTAVDAPGPVDFSLYGTGQLSLAGDTLALQTTTEFALQSPSGAVDGTVEWAQRDGRPTYSGRLRADSLDLSPWAAVPYASALTGRARFDGSGTRRTTMDGTLDLALQPSSVAGRALDSLHIAARAERGRFASTTQVWHPGRGYLQAETALDLLPAQPSYTATLLADRFDLSTLPLDGLPPTQLTGQLQAEGAGRRLAEATGQLALQLDSSRVTYRGAPHLIPPHRTTLALADRAADGPRLTLGGDVATLEVAGDVAFEPLWALGNLWGRALADAARREVNKPYNPPLASAAASEAVGPVPPPAASAPAAPVVPAAWRARARAALAAAGLSDELALETTFAIRRADVLEALLPFAPRLQTDLAGRVSVSAGADRMVLDSALRGTTLSLPGLSADSISVALSASGNFRAPLAETFSADLDVRGAAARVGPLSLRAPHVSFDYLSRQALLQFDAEEDGRTGPFRLSATADLLPDRNEITLYDLHAEAADHAWTSQQPSTIDAYADALIIPELRLRSRHPAADRTQEVRVHGAFSTSPQDTVVAEARNVMLESFSELGRLRRPVGGILNGSVALAGGWANPQATSQLAVDWLSFDRRLLGHLDLTSRFEPGSPDLLVDGTLRSMAAEADSVAPAFLPYAPRRTERNRLAVTGRVRLPGAAPSPAAADAAADAAVEAPLDLQLTVDRADLFFFEYIFATQIANVSGHLTGEAHIGGTWRRPRFDAALRAVDGRFELPQFNLQYGIEGPIAVDAEGIKLNNVAVTGPDDGSARVSGAVLFNAYQYFSFDLQATLREMRIIDVARSQDLPFYGRISASGPVTLTGPLSGATLRSSDARTTPDSELFIPVTEGEISEETGFIIFADSTGRIPDLREVTRRDNILADRPEGEPSFLDALDLDLNVLAPQGSTVNLVFDPLLGDVVTAVGAGRVQIQRQEGEFFTYGTLEVNTGEYLFTAGEVFVRRFSIDGGSITWDGSPTNAQLDLDASYRTRASTAGLGQYNNQRSRIPVIIQLDITGRVNSPRVDLNLAIDSRDRNVSFAGEALQSVFNQPDLATEDLATEYATSVLLTNTFLLTTSSASTRQQTGTDTGDRLTDAGNQLAFNSVSQLVASQLNRYLSEALPNLDVNLGVQGEDPQDLDVIYGVALRLLDERLIIRGEGVYQGDEEQRRRTEGIEGEFVVEVRLSRNVSAEAFYRRSGDEILSDQTLTSTTGAGLSYQTEFTTWRDFFRRVFYWFIPGGADDDEDPSRTAPAASTAPPPAAPPPAADSTAADSTAADSTAAGSSLP